MMQHERMKIIDGGDVSFALQPPYTPEKFLVFFYVIG
jgi:hypothetical protein